MSIVRTYTSPICNGLQFDRKFEFTSIYFLVIVNARYLFFLGWMLFWAQTGFFLVHSLSKTKQFFPFSARLGSLILLCFVFLENQKLDRDWFKHFILYWQQQEQQQIQSSRWKAPLKAEKRKRKKELGHLIWSCSIIDGWPQNPKIHFSQTQNTLREKKEKKKKTFELHPVRPRTKLFTIWEP